MGSRGGGLALSEVRRSVSWAPEGIGLDDEVCTVLLGPGLDVEADVNARSCDSEVLS